MIVMKVVGKSCVSGDLERTLKALTRRAMWVVRSIDDVTVGWTDQIWYSSLEVSRPHIPTQRMMLPRTGDLLLMNTRIFSIPRSDPMSKSGKVYRTTKAVAFFLVTSIHDGDRFKRFWMRSLIFQNIAIAKAWWLVGRMSDSHEWQSRSRSSEVFTQRCAEPGGDAIGGRKTYARECFIWRIILSLEECALL
jgi:hypothetical protein